MIGLCIKMFAIFLFLCIGLVSSDASEENPGQAGYTYSPLSFSAFAKAWRLIAKSEEKLQNLFEVITDRSESEGSNIYSLVTDEVADTLYTVVEQNDGPLYAVDAEQTTEGPLYTAVDPDQTTEGPLYTAVDPDQTTEGPLYTAVDPDQTTEGPLYTAIDPELTTEEGIFYTVEPEFTEMSTNEQNELQRRVGASFEEATDAQVASTEQSIKPVEKLTKGISCDPESSLSSIRGTPGVHFPDYSDIPVTSFSCEDEKYVPGFYADLETGCQVFHVCWPHRRESLLCPVGTTFNQAILACDYWYNTNCSLAPLFFDVNALSPEADTMSGNTATMMDTLIKSTQTETPTEHAGVSDSSLQDSDDVTDEDVSCIVKFLPVKSKVIHYPEQKEFEAKKPHLVELKSKASDIDKVDIASEIIKEIQKSAQTAVKEVEQLIPRIISKLEKLPQRPVLKHPKKQIQRQSVPKIDPRFVTKQIPVLYVQEPKNSDMPSKSVRESIPLRSRIVKFHQKPPGKKDAAVSEIIMQALEAAGSLLQDDILPATRRLMVDNLVVASKNKS